MTYNEELNKYKQLCDLILEELNIHEVVIGVCNSEQGKISLVYCKKESNFYFIRGNEKIIPKPESKLLLEVLKSSFIK